MNRFVVLLHYYHDDRKNHWDLMLQSGGTLLTWALPPQAEPQTILGPFTTDAKRSPDHRIEYLHYEGPVSANRGEVRQWDAGTYQKNPDGTWTLQGKFFRGILTIEPINNEQDNVQISYLPC